MTRITPKHILAGLALAVLLLTTANARPLPGGIMIDTNPLPCYPPEQRNCEQEYNYCADNAYNHGYLGCLDVANTGQDILDCQSDYADELHGCWTDAQACEARNAAIAAGNNPDTCPINN